MAERTSPEFDLGFELLDFTSKDDFFMKYTTLLAQLIKKRKKITILLIGRVGRGKSALVNRLFKKDVVPEGCGPNAVSLFVSCHKIKYEGIDVTIADTPGFFDSDEQRKNKDVFREIDQKVSGFDLVLFCIKMNDRLESSDTMLMKMLTERYGENIWKCCLFALTFANEVPSSRSVAEADRKRQFERLLTQWKETIAKKLSLPFEVPIIPVGAAESQLADRDDWFTPFWFEALNQVNKNAKPAFLKISLPLFERSIIPGQLNRKVVKKTVKKLAQQRTSTCTTSKQASTWFTPSPTASTHTKFSDASSSGATSPDKPAKASSTANLSFDDILDFLISALASFLDVFEAHDQPKKGQK